MDAVSIKRDDPMIAGGTYNPSTGLITDLPKIVALREAGVPVIYAGRHKRSNRHYYQIGSGLYTEPVCESITESKPQSVMDLYLNAL